MAHLTLGKQHSDRPQTPTLRQYHKNTGKLPLFSHVKVIFRPGKLPYFTLVTDHDFKVVVSEDNPLHGVLTDELESWAKDNTCLLIRPDQDKIGSWELSSDTDNNSEWEEKDWGYSLSGYGTKAKKTRKTHP